MHRPGNRCRNCGLENHPQATGCWRCSAPLGVNYLHFDPPPPAPKSPTLPPVSPAVLAIAAAIVFVAVVAFFAIQITGKLGKPELPEPVSLSPSQSAGYYKSYRFIFQKQEVPKVITFQPKMLPPDESIFMDATRAIIEQCFDEKVSSDGVRSDMEYVFSGPTRRFRVEPFLTDSGEIHAMVISIEMPDARTMR